MSKPKLLITGSRGVLGNSFRRNLALFSDFEVHFTSGRECNLANQSECNDLFEKVRPDYVFHIAAKSGGIGLSSKFQASHLHDNALMAFNIAENCVEFGIKKCIFTLSVGMYPAEANLPIVETSNLTGPPHNSNFGYAYAKAIIEPLISTYREQHDINFIGLVPNGIFGPEDNFHPEHSPMLPSLIRKAFLAKKNVTKIDVWGDGSPLRQYTYADDYVKIYKWALEKYDSEKILNVGTSEEKSILEIAKLICKFSGLLESDINFLTDKPKGIHRRPMSNQRFIELSNFEYTTLSEGIEKTCRWYNSNADKIKSASKE